MIHQLPLVWWEGGFIDWQSKFKALLTVNTTQEAVDWKI